jgi:hypothetical protein
MWERGVTGIPEPRLLPDARWIWGYIFYPRLKLGWI